MFGKQKKDTTQYAAVIDIGSATVGVGIISSTPGEDGPRILYTERTMVSTKGNEPSIRKLEETLLSTSLLLSQKGIPLITHEHPHARISSLYVVCAAPWSKTEIATLHHSETTPRKVTHALLDELIIEHDHLAKTSDTTPEKQIEKFESVERATLSIALNGYEMKRIDSATASTIDISYASGKYQKDILPIISNIHSKLFIGADLHYHTQMLISYCVIRDMFPRNVHALIINITGEATECGVIEDGNLVHIDSFSYGFHTMIRNIMNETNKPFDDVVTLIRDAQTSIQHEYTDITSYTEEYVTQLKNTLTRMTDVVTIPDTTFVTTQETFEPLFNKIVHATVKEYAGESTTTIPLTTALLQHTPTHEYRDAYFTLAASFFHKVAFTTEKKN